VEERPLKDPFGRLITDASLAKLAGEKSFARGAGYFDAGAVTDLLQTRDAVRPTVAGNDDYRVILKPAGRTLDWSCTCPLGDEGTFCKHAVAAGLAWLAREGRSGDDLAGLRVRVEVLAAESLRKAAADELDRSVARCRTAAASAENRMAHQVAQLCGRGREYSLGPWCVDFHANLTRGFHRKLTRVFRFAV
jgi:uncharacterized Zn finger protein